MIIRQACFNSPSSIDVKPPLETLDVLEWTCGEKDFLAQALGLVQNGPDDEVKGPTQKVSPYYGQTLGLVQNSPDVEVS